MATSQSEIRKNIAIVGGGPAALFLFKRILEERRTDIAVTIFEGTDRLGQGMPYSEAGANIEHITNVSSNEVPELIKSVAQWIKTLSPEILKEFGLEAGKITEYKVLPRLLFGTYLSAQFDELIRQAEGMGVKSTIRLNTIVTDIRDEPEHDRTVVVVGGGIALPFDAVILCTGHMWPRTHEGKIPGYFDSPYPPKKLANRFNHPIAIRGSSLTAIDAIRTLARSNGEFVRQSPTSLSYAPHPESEHFKIVMHSREGFLPAIRFHLEDPLLLRTALVSEEELHAHRNQNDGFISLDFLFEKDFKESLRKKEPDFYECITLMNIEEFVAMMMKERELTEPFSHFKREFEDARESIRHKESIYWKEKLTILSIALNYPAKYFTAEDRVRLQQVLMPLISLVIAFVPQSSCEELIALHDSGRLELIAVGSESRLEPRASGGIMYHYTDQESDDRTVVFETFIDCIGQRHLSFDEFPFFSLKEEGSVSPARLRFRSPEHALQLKQGDDKNIEQLEDGVYYLKVPGIAINDDFQIIDVQGRANNRVYVMAVPLIGGYNPDYSGLDFCEEASKRVVTRLLAPE